MSKIYLRIVSLLVVTSLVLCSVNGLAQGVAPEVRRTAFSDSALYNQQALAANPLSERLPVLHRGVPYFAALLLFAFPAVALAHPAIHSLSMSPPAFYNWGHLFTKLPGLLSGTALVMLGWAAATGGGASENKDQQEFEDAAAAFEATLRVNDLKALIPAIEALRFHQQALSRQLTYRGFEIPTLANAIVREQSTEYLHKHADVSAEEKNRVELLKCQVFLFDYLTMMAACVIHGGVRNAPANLVRLRQLLEALQSPDAFYQFRQVDDVAELFQFPPMRYSSNEAQLIQRERAYIWLFSGTGPNRYSRRAVHEVGRHLRGTVFEAFMRMSDTPAFRRTVDRLRVINSMDYVVMILNLVPLLEHYDRHGSDPALALDIVSGISGDPRAFTDRAVLETINPKHAQELLEQAIADHVLPFSPGTLYPVHLGDATLKKYFALLQKNRDRLLNDLKTLEPHDPEAVSNLLAQQDTFANIRLAQIQLARLETPEAGRGLVYADLNKPFSTAAQRDWRYAIDLAGLRLKRAYWDTDLNERVQTSSPYLGREALKETLRRLSFMFAPAPQPIEIGNTRPSLEPVGVAEAIEIYRQYYEHYADFYRAEDAWVKLRIRLSASKDAEPFITGLLEQSDAADQHLKDLHKKAVEAKALIMQHRPASWEKVQPFYARLGESNAAWRPVHDRMTQTSKRLSHEEIAHFREVTELAHKHAEEFLAEFNKVFPPAAATDVTPIYAGLAIGMTGPLNPVDALAFLTGMEFILRNGPEALEMGIQLWFASLKDHVQHQNRRLTLYAA